jgi:hypothetical protein
MFVAVLYQYSKPYSLFVGFAGLVIVSPSVTVLVMLAVPLSALKITVNVWGSSIVQLQKEVPSTGQAHGAL